MRIDLLCLLSLAAIITMTQFTQADAAKIDAIGITIERSCLLSSNCVTYHDLIPFDSAPQTIGQLVTKAGDTKRFYTPKQDNPEWLRFDTSNGRSFNQTVIIVDPPSRIGNTIKKIIIVPQLDEYHTPKQFKIKEYNQTGDNAKPTHSIREYSHTRAVDKRCNEAVITAKNWRPILIDTIQYLKSGCTDTLIPTISQDIKPLTKHDIKTSAKYKLEKWQKEIIKNCTKSRNACTDLAQPTRGGL